MLLIQHFHNLKKKVLQQQMIFWNILPRNGKSAHRSNTSHFSPSLLGKELIYSISKCKFCLPQMLNRAHEFCLLVWVEVKCHYLSVICDSFLMWQWEVVPFYSAASPDPLTWHYNQSHYSRTSMARTPLGPWKSFEPWVVWTNEG